MGFVVERGWGETSCRGSRSMFKHIMVMEEEGNAVINLKTIKRCDGGKGRRIMKL